MIKLTEWENNLEVQNSDVSVQKKKKIPGMNTWRKYHEVKQDFFYRKSYILLFISLVDIREVSYCMGEPRTQFARNSLQTV